MFERMTSVPEQAPLTCVKLPSQETGLAREEMKNTLGGTCFPGEDPYDYYEHIVDAVAAVGDAADDIGDIISQWWG